MCQTELEPISNVKFEVDFYKHSSRFHKIVLLSVWLPLSHRLIPNNQGIWKLNYSYFNYSYLINISVASPILKSIED